MSSGDVIRLNRMYKCPGYEKYKSDSIVVPDPGDKILEDEVDDDVVSYDEENTSEKLSDE